MVKLLLQNSLKQANNALNECQKETCDSTRRSHAKTLREFIHATEVLGEEYLGADALDNLNYYRGALSKVIIMSNINGF